jgi:phosphatidate phosphatase APP1
MYSVRKLAHKIKVFFTQKKLKLKDSFNLFDPVIIYPYRGYGNGQSAWIHGRILEKEEIIHGDEEQKNSLLKNIRKIWKRYASDEIPGVELEGEFMGIKTKTTSDEDGYFSIVFNGLDKKYLSDGWHQAILKISHMPYSLKYDNTARASVLICNQQKCFGIISDVDDTIIKSRAMNTFKKMKIMLTKNAENREAFDGVPALFEKLTANGKNPLFFVSGSSYNLYDMLVEFCEHQKIPKAPFLLRNLGLTPEQWIKQDTRDYKKDHIVHLLNVFDQMSFILIGDSGQKDPEIYADICKNYPDQIKAIYIRHVHTNKRRQQLERMTEQMNVPFLVVTDSKSALEHAANQKWI